MGSVDDTLLVRHLPSQLSNDDKEELLRHFGALRIKVMGTRGAMKHTAFLTFTDNMTATKALNRLHQLEVLGCKLVAEFAKKSQQKHFPSMSDFQRRGKIKEEEKKDKWTEDKSQNLPSADAVYKKWGVNYPRNPKLCYLYPPPTVSIVTNIANALASCPKFYVQVLHLMNKMNLPAPFGAVTPTPPIPLKEATVILEPDNIKIEEMEVSSTEESEIESEGESQKKSTDRPSLKRHIRKKPKLSSKRPKFLENLEIPVQSNVPVMQPSKVFENVQEQLQAKKIQLKIPEAIVHEPSQETAKTVDGLLTDVLSSLNKEEEVKTDGGFGKIEPVKKLSENVETKDSDLPYTVDPSKFLPIEEIQKGRISKSEWQNYSVFRKYEAGERTKRLYLKNLNKHTSEQDLVDIFGKYVDWNSETEKSMFDIRVMKEGRMKGQGFITLPSEEAAEKAMNDTNGYVLNNKPMAVQYARSAKAKDVTDEKS